MYAYPKRPDEIYHYGIKRRSGRYPWGSGKRPYQRDNIKGNYKISKYTSPTAVNIKNGTISVGLGLLSYAFPPAVLAYYVISAKRGINEVQSIKGKDYRKKEGDYYKSLNELKKKEQKTSIEEDLKKVNPGFVKGYGKTNNCVNCVQAMELRRRGYDVQSRSAATGRISDYSKRFDGYETKRLNYEKTSKMSRKEYIQSSYNDALNVIEKEGEGARGCFNIFYDKKLNQVAGHTMFWEITNGEVKIYDPQSGKDSVAQKCLSLSDPSSWSYGRLDNLKLNDSITESVINVKEDKK